MDEIITKKCTKCGEYKRVSEFTKHKNRYDGLDAWCKTCKRLCCANYRNKNHDSILKKVREKYENERDSINAARRKKRADNPEIDRAKCKAWRDNNPEKKRASDKRWRDENRDKWRGSYKAAKEKMFANSPEKVRQYMAAWRARYPEKEAAMQENRRARIVGNGGKIKSSEWKEMCSKYGNKCLCCGKDNARLTMDHVIPISRGGNNSIENIQPLCGKCNSKKGTKVIDFRVGIDTKPVEKQAAFDVY